MEADANQLPGARDAHRLVLTAGNFAASDIFDANGFAHDGRTQFLNWSFLTHGAYDYAADAHGYSWGAALEYYAPPGVLRIGRFLEPKQSNGMRLDWSVGRHHGDQIEYERGWTLGRDELAGRARLLLYRNKAVMGSFREALVYGGVAGAAPSVADVRRLQSKTGQGINVEQALDDKGSGTFLRLSRHDGATETYSFTGIDRALSLGGVVGGAYWGRAQDSVGLAWARNGLSRPHRAYLAAGGLGFFLGDGALSYRPESALEACYQIRLGGRAGGRFQSSLMLGLQRIRNPGYNAARGPVNVGSARLHVEF
ncbi:MAG: carbohydrate porin [Pseudomonas sp.]